MKRRALIVDDDRSMVKTLSDVLQFKGWDVSTAYSGSEAVQVASQAPYDVILMDIKMPGMDGVDAFKAIKAKRPDIKVVLMTAYAAQDRIVEAEREGVLRVLPKPVNIGMLLDFLADTLGNNKPVLLIDSDAVFLKTLSEVLQLRGFETILAQNVEQAKLLMAEKKPRAVLLHMRLGSASARDAIVAVHDISPSVALILYSGEPGAIEEAGLNVPLSWIHAYLQKPLAIDQITGVLNAVRSSG